MKLYSMNYTLRAVVSIIVVVVHLMQRPQSCFYILLWHIFIADGKAVIALCKYPWVFDVRP